MKDFRIDTCFDDAKLVVLRDRAKEELSIDFIVEKVDEKTHIVLKTREELSKVLNLMESIITGTPMRNVSGPPQVLFGRPEDDIHPGVELGSWDEVTVFDPIN